MTGDAQGRRDASTGDIEQVCLTAGQSAGNIDEILPAGEMVRRMTSEAKAALAGLAATREAA